MHVRALRKNMTDAEHRLWYFLRAKRFHNYKFRRQHLFYPFIVDFVCMNKKLIIELDGGQHAENCQYDERRSRRLKAKGFQVLRFWNNEVLETIEGVLEKILQELEGR